MNNEYSYLTDMQENCKLYGMVEIDQLRAVWKSRKFAIQVPDSIVQSGLLPSIFDWQLLGQLMPAEQTTAEMLLQQRINDLELLNSLTTALQRIQIVPEIGLDVDVIMGRPSYNVLVQDDGSILVKELPSLLIHVFAAESRAAAGQECIMDEPNLMASEQRKQLAALVGQKATLFSESGIIQSASTGEHLAEPEESTDEPTELPQDPNEELGQFEDFLERTCSSLKINHKTISDQMEHDLPDTQPDDLDVNVNDAKEQQEQQEQEEQQQEQEQEKEEKEQQEEKEAQPMPTEAANQIVGPIETRLRRRQPFWMRFGNWLRQSLPRL
ncbi:uncharacterized protein [Drosophila virilis]|uniref:Uncharacterized protein n=1 Tax=Drosophila virilis TaxID=7244 RepID=B4MB12_DROVI|nr:vacuolar protein-sorting-associated protein 36 [Drosophila virilis]EDW66421.1 uncharacterized protein Dvir_GJ15561 [Drosophila virilis]